MAQFSPAPAWQRPSPQRPSEVVAPQFAGLRPLKRHQLVYAAIGPEVGRELHALSIRALTPEEAAAAAN